MRAAGFVMVVCEWVLIVCAREICWRKNVCDERKGKRKRASYVASSGYNNGKYEICQESYLGYVATVQHCILRGTELPRYSTVLAAAAAVCMRANAYFCIFTIHPCRVACRKWCCVKKPPSCRAWLLFFSRLLDSLCTFSSNRLCCIPLYVWSRTHFRFVVCFLKISLLGFTASCVSAFPCACTLNNWMQDATAFSHFRDRWQTQIEQTKKKQKTPTADERRRRLRSKRRKIRKCIRIRSLLLLLLLTFWFISFLISFCDECLHSSFSFWVAFRTPIIFIFNYLVFVTIEFYGCKFFENQFLFLLFSLTFFMTKHISALSPRSILPAAFSYCGFGFWCRRTLPSCILFSSSSFFSCL